MSRWLAATSLTGWASSQAYIYVAGAILGPAGLGGLKAAQTLVAGPAGVLIQAGGSIGLPEASKAHAEKGWAGLVRVSRAVTAAGVVSFVAGALIVLFWGRTLLSKIYGPQFAHLELAAVLIAIAYIFMGYSVGPVLVLKTTRNAHRIFYIQIATLVVSLAAVTALSLRFGITGAAIATIATYLAAAVGARWCQRVVRRAPVDQSIESIPEPVGDSATEPAVPSIGPGMVARPSALTSWLMAVVLRRRLSRPTPALQLVEQRLRAHLESACGGALVVVEVNAAHSAALAVAALARSLTSEGKRVVLADAADGRPLAALLGSGDAGGGVRMVPIEGREVALFVAPDDPTLMGYVDAGEDADMIMILATVDPALGADHLATWASDAVVMVRSNRASATRIEAVGHQLRRADMTVKAAVTIGTELDTSGSPVPAGFERVPGRVAYPFPTALWPAAR